MPKYEITIYRTEYHAETIEEIEADSLEQAEEIAMEMDISWDHKTIVDSDQYVGESEEIK